MTKQLRGWSLLVAVLLCAAVATPAWGGWALVDNFDTYVVGNPIDGQGNWTGTMNPANATVANRPSGGPASQSLRMFEVTRARNGADLPTLTGGTFFFQVNMEQVSGYNNFRVTLSDQASPTSYTQSDVFFRMNGRTNQNDNWMWRNQVKVGTGDANQTVTNYRLDDDVWYNVWVDVNQPAKTYEVYVAPPGAPAPTQLAVGGTTTFNFDDAGAGPLESVWLWSDGTTNGKAIHLDNMHVDTAGSNLTSPLAALPVVTLTGSHPYGQTWTNGTYWSDNQAAHAGALYVIPSGLGMRTPNNASNPVFPGDALTLQTGGNIGLKHNGTVTFNDLHMAGGKTNTAVQNRTMAIGGNMTVDADSTISISGGDTRTTELRSTLYGDADLHIVGGTTGTSRFILRADTSMYNGNFTVDANMENLYVDRGTMRVTGGLDLNLLRVGYDPGTGELIALDGAVSVVDPSQVMDIGRRNAGGLSGSPTTTGIANFAAASGVVLDVSQLRIGTINGSPSGEGKARGDLILSQAGNNSITADSILVGDSSTRGTDVMSTIQLGGALNTISTDTLTLGGRKGQGSMTMAAGGTLTLGGKSGAEVDVNLGINVNGTGTNSIGTIDTLGGTINATIDQLRMGNQNNGTGSGTGNLLFDAGTVSVNDVTMATGNKSAATITQTGGTLTIVGNVTDGTGTSSLNVDDGTATIGGNLSIDNVRVGYTGGTGSLTVQGSVDIHGTTLDVGRRESTNVNTAGTFDASASPSVTIDVDNLRLGTATGGSSSQATGVLWLSQAGPNNINATTITIGDCPNSGNTAATSVLHLGGANTIQADTVYVGRRKSRGEISFATTGTLDIGTPGDRVSLRIGRNGVNSGTTDEGLMDLTGATGGSLYLDALVVGHKFGGGSGNSQGTLLGGNLDLVDVNGSEIRVGRNTDSGSNTWGLVDLSGVTQFNATVTDFDIGNKSNTGNGKVRGRFTLAQSNTIDAGTMIVGSSGNNGADSLADRNELHLGATNNILVDTLIVGQRKTTGLIDFTNPGGTLDLGSAARRVDMLLGHKNTSTANNATGTLDVRDGTANIYASQIRLGRESNNSNSGTPSGIMWLGDGMLDVTGNIHEDNAGGGNGSSTLNVVGTQTFNIGGVIDVDNFRAGYRETGSNGGNGTVTAAAGSAFRVGDGNGNFDIGYRNKAIATTTQGTVDLSAATSVAIDVDNLRLGRIANIAQEGGTQGILRLSAAGANTITANAVLLGDSPQRGNTTFTSEIALGGSTNAIQANTITIAGRKSNAQMTILPGGSLDIQNRAGGGRADLYIARNNVGTAAKITGMVDLSGGANFTALLDELALGIKSGGSSGTATGTLILAQNNLIDANTILVGDSGDAGQTTAALASTVQLGQTNTILADTMTIGGRKTNATMTLPAGGTVTLGSAARLMDLNVSRNNHNTGTNPVAILETRGGTLNGFFDQIVLGHKSGGGSGGADGTLAMSDGAVTANSLILGQGPNATGTFILDGGTVSIGTVDIQSASSAFQFNGGVFTPGEHDTTQFIGTYTQGAGGTLLIGLDAPGDSDVLQVTGGVNLDGLLEITMDYLPGEMSQFIIVDNDDADAIAGVFDNAPSEGDLVYATLGSSQQAFAITYTGGTGNDVALTAVPEPATMLALAAGLAGMGGYLRRRRRA